MGKDYLTIQGWMITELNLKSNNLLIYALIYNFSKDGKSCFRGSQKYLSKWINGSVRTVQNCLVFLKESNLIIESDDGYQVNFDMLKGEKNSCFDEAKDEKISEKSENFSQKGENISYKNKESKENKEKTKKESPAFKKPNVCEIDSYCRERSNGIDPHEFYDFYESKGWMIGKSHMKDWKAAVRTWERNRASPTRRKAYSGIPEV